jgi:hypothetical protein
MFEELSTTRARTYEEENSKLLKAKVPRTVLTTCLSMSSFGAVSMIKHDIDAKNLKSLSYPFPVKASLWTVGVLEAKSRHESKQWERRSSATR